MPKLFRRHSLRKQPSNSILKIEWIPIAWVFLLLAVNTIAAQELPPIENFTPNDYGAENQNWGISQSEEKNIYVANNAGLLEFNGAAWQLYGSPNGSTIRSVKAIDALVYTGCYMEFGYWKKNEFGTLEYASISSELEIPLLEDEEFWNILKLDQWVLFQSLERIYSYNVLDKSVKVVDSKSTKAHMFAFQETIYFHSYEKGLFKIENGTPVLVSDDARLKDTMVVGFFSIDNKPLLVTEKGAFYFFENGNLRRWRVPFNATAETINVYSSLQLENGSMVLGTISNGIYHLDTKGKLIQKINQNRGLNNNTVLSLFEDEENDVWLALDNGISVINFDAPFAEYIDKNGALGVVYASAVHKNYLYLGTNQGLFCKNLEIDEGFSLIKNTGGQVWRLKVIDDALFCGHNKGTFIINKENAQLISNFPGAWDFKVIPNQKNLLLQGNFKGLSVLEKSDDSWALRNVIEGFDISSRFFEFTSAQRLLVNHEFKGVFTIDLDDSYRKVTAIKNENAKGIGAGLITYLNDIVYTCDTGIYKYNDQQAAFSLDSLLTKELYGGTDDPVGIFTSDAASKRLWSFTNSNMVYVSPSNFNAELQVKRIAIPTQVRKNLGVLGFESLTKIGREKYLIGISNGYLTLDLNKLKNRKHSVRLHTIENKTADSEIEKVAKYTDDSFEYEQNNLFFYYNVPEFDKYTEVRYQYLLAGMYNRWSDWSNTSSVSFENLPFGNYAFKVRAKIGKEFSENVAVYEFRIERPWYLSNLAIVLYVLAFALLALAIHKLYKNHYQKEQERLLRASKKKIKRKKLKAEKKIIQIKNEKLREEVASKNRELAISTMSIIKKNEFLNAIKGQLKENDESALIKSVIRTIDRNINNSDDWKFFEEAFNNADKDFLKKIKNKHSELTANDLKLCAYLRLNLSSKEIAPLLNISIRSVEVKRYRLRKKMNLPHEEGLADYIFNL